MPRQQHAKRLNSLDFPCTKMAPPKKGRAGRAGLGVVAIQGQRAPSEPHGAAIPGIRNSRGGAWAKLVVAALDELPFRMGCGSTDPKVGPFSEAP